MLNLPPPFKREYRDKIAISNRSATLALITIFWVIEQETYPIVYLHYSSISRARINILSEF